MFRRVTIIVDQTCISLVDHLRALAPVFVFTRVGSVLTSPDAAVDELRDALQQSGLCGPYLMVAASFAGFTALLYASRHPDEVAGLVLVDSSHPKQTEATLAALPEPESDNAEVAAFRNFLRGPGQEWREGCQMLLGLSSLGDLPLIVLAAGVPPMPASLPQLVRAGLVETWHSLQRDHACRSNCGEMRVVEGCGHAIASEAPQAVVDAVADLLRKVAANRELKAP